MSSSVYVHTHTRTQENTALRRLHEEVEEANAPGSSKIDVFKSRYLKTSTQLREQMTKTKNVVSSVHIWVVVVSS